MSGRKLTAPMLELLEELVEAEDGLYIARQSRYFRTAQALVDRGLVERAWVDHSPMAQDHYVPTDLGASRLGVLLPRAVQ